VRPGVGVEHGVRDEPGRPDDEVADAQLARLDRDGDAILVGRGQVRLGGRGGVPLAQRHVPPAGAEVVLGVLVPEALDLLLDGEDEAAGAGDPLGRRRGGEVQPARSGGPAGVEEGVGHEVHEPVGPVLLLGDGAAGRELLVPGALLVAGELPVDGRVLGADAVEQLVDGLLGLLGLGQGDGQAVAGSGRPRTRPGSARQQRRGRGRRGGRVCRRRRGRRRRRTAARRGRRAIEGSAREVNRSDPVAVRTIRVTVCGR
jgi:hypothetical protein